MAETTVDQILLLEDDKTDALLAEHMIERAVGAQVRRVTTCAEAEAVLRLGRVDAVVTGLVLPDAVGPEAIRRLNLLAPTVPIVALTASDDSLAARQAITAGAEDFIAKGELRVASLRRTLRHAIDRKAEKVAQLERQRRAMQEQHYRAIGQLSRQVIQEVNHALTILISEVEELELSGAVPAGDPGTTDILRQADRIADLMRQLLRAVPHRQKGMTADAGRVIAAQQQLLASYLGPSAQLDVDLPTIAAPIPLNEETLVQLILPLLTNAREAGGGQIRLRCKVVPGEAVSITVQDNGAGMTEEVRSRAMEPFFGTKGRAQGAGLGLTVVRDTVASCGGTLLLESLPGAGTHATLRFPLADQPVAV